MAQENAQVKSTVVEQDATGQLTASAGGVVEQGKHAPKQKAPVNK